MILDLRSRLFITKKVELRECEHLAVFCARIEYIQQGWRLIRLLDTKGKETSGTLLAKFTISSNSQS